MTNKKYRHFYYNKLDGYSSSFIGDDFLKSNIVYVDFILKKIVPKHWFALQRAILYNEYKKVFPNKL